MHLAAMAVVFAGLLPAATSAQDYSWTPCHRLEMGGKLHEICRACEGQGSGWRFYVSRNGAVSQCQRDPQASSGIYGKPWEDDDPPEPKRSTRPVRPTVVPATPAPRPEARSRATSNPPSTTRPATNSAAPSEAAATGKRGSRPQRESEEPRSPASHAAVPPRRTTEREHVASPKPKPARTEAENRRETERRQEQKKGEP